LQKKSTSRHYGKRDFFCGFIFFQGAIFWISAQFEPKSGDIAGAALQLAHLKAAAALLRT
jgi:hypothetical protein